jgi:GT2 family glycosyltransferase
MSQALTVSVVVPTFNRARYLGECLDSLLAQTEPAHQIIVVDDGSEDDTPAVLESFRDRVTVLRKPNGGKPSAVNLALGRCTGRLIWLFDDDDVALPDAIERRVAELAMQPGSGFVYSPHYVGANGPDGRITRGPLYVPPRPSKDAFFVELTQNCFFHLNSALVRRELYGTLGGIDPTFRSGEDYDFQLRLARSCVPAYCASPSFVFRQHDGMRGAKSASYTAAQRTRAFRASSGAIGRKLRRDVQLQDFLVPAGRETPLGRAASEALVHRALAMANHGCIDELFDDLCALAAQAAAGELSDEQLGALEPLMRRGWAFDSCSDNWGHFEQRLSGLVDQPSGASIARVITYGVARYAKSYPGSIQQRSLRLLRAARMGWIAFRRGIKPSSA